MKKRAGDRVYKQTVVNAVILVVIVALFIYLGIQLSSGFSLRVSTQRTQKVTDSNYAHLTGYIFRDDTTIYSDADVVCYAVRDGEKVGVGQTYAEVFSNTGLSDAEANEKEKDLESVSQKIFLLENGLGYGNNASDVGSIKNSISQNRYAYIDAILDGNISAADKSGDALLSAMVDYSAIRGGEAAKNQISALKDEKERLLLNVGGNRRALVSDKSFSFFHSADGYEDIFHTSNLEGLTAEGLDALIASEPQSTAGTIGKMTYTSKWYLAIPIDEANFEAFKKLLGQTLSVGFSDTDGLTLDMLLERVYAEEDDPNSAYMLLSSHSLSHVAFLDRIQNVSILLDSRSGYRIPDGALHNVDGQEGVYILVGNVVEFRRVTVISRGEGYYIVNTYEVDLLEKPLSKIPYLNINDMIVTSGNDLYDGKQLD